MLAQQVLFIRASALFILVAFCAPHSSAQENLTKYLLKKYGRPTLSDLPSVGAGDADLTEVIAAPQLGPQVEDAHGATLLHHACFAGQRDAVKKLLAKGLDPNKADCWKITPVDLACLWRTGHKEQYQDILQSLLSTNIKPETYNSALATSATFGQKSALKLLLQNAKEQGHSFSNFAVRDAITKAHNYGHQKTAQFLAQRFVHVPGLPTADHVEKEPKEQAYQLINKNRFSIDRGLSLYLKNLGPAFQKFLSEAGEHDHILDAGSGETVAMRQYACREKVDELSQTGDESLVYQQQQKAKVTAVTFKISPEALLKAGFVKNLTVIHGRLFEDISKEEITGTFGLVSCIVDFFGVLAYSPKPSQVLRQYFKLLRDDGRIFLMLGPKDPDNFYDYRYRQAWATPGGGSGSLHAFLVRRCGGKKLSFPQWLHTIPGIGIRSHIIERSVKKEAGTIQYPSFEVYEIKLTERKKIAVPELEMVDINARSTPPQRRIFREREQSARL